MSGDFTVKVDMPLSSCPECGAEARTITPFVSNDSVRFVYRCGSNHRYERTVPLSPSVVDAIEQRGARTLSYSFVASASSSGHSMPSALEMVFRGGREESQARAAHEVAAESRALRRYTEEPAGPLEVLVMSLGRELHDAEHVDCDWFGHTSSTVSSFCRRACEARGLNWKWVQEAITRERSEDFYTDIR